MHVRALAVIALFCFEACSRESAPPKVSTTPERAAGPAIAPISKWALDPENSSVTFVCKHVFTNVRGMFQQPSGTVRFDEATPANSSVEASLNVNAITTGVEERDTHLKSSDFFDAVKYPTITFTSTSFSKSAASYSVTGQLTMHGVTKPVTLAFTASPPFNHGGGIRRAIEGTLSVNRKEFGLLWDYPGEGPGAVVGDTITITIDAELVLQADATPGG